MNANAYGGELAARARWVDVVGPAGPSGARPTSSASPIAARACAPARWWRGRPSPARGGPATRSRRRWRTCGPGARRPSLPGIKTFGSTFKNPVRPARRGPQRGPAARCGGLPGLRIGGAGFSAQACELHREPRRREHVRRRRGHGRGPPARAGALRGRRSSRGAGARAGRVAGRVEPGVITERRLPVRIRLLLAVVGVLAGVAGGAWLWVRDSSLVAVRKVTISGVYGPDSGRIRSA